jgi:hypothetical protein
VRTYDLLSRILRHAARSGNVSADVDATVAANTGERGTTHTHVSSRRRVVQRSGRTVVDEETRERRERKED